MPNNTPTSSRLTFETAGAPITQPVSKFGGQPVWLSQPELPKSRRTAEPMTFICQLVVPRAWCPDDALRIAYVFMTGGGFDQRAMETWSPDDGETWVCVQTLDLGCEPQKLSSYPDTLKVWTEVNNRRFEVPCEYAVAELISEEAAFMQEAEVDALPDKQREAVLEGWRGNKIGGSPYWLQYPEFPYKDWRLLLQLEDGTYPFNLNLGTGVGYVFLNATVTEG